MMDKNNFSPKSLMMSYGYNLQLIQCHQIYWWS